MNRKLIAGIAVVGVLSVGSVANALINNDPVKENHASVQRSEAVEGSLQHSDTVESQPATQTETTQPVQVQEQPTAAPVAPQTSPAVQEEPFDAQLYASTILAAKARQGVSVNAECFNKLMSEAHGWNLDQSQVDQAAAKVFGYPSTCAAYASFQTGGAY